MRTYRFAILFLLVFGLSVPPASAQDNTPQTTNSPLGGGFSYQGHLKDASGNPLTATCDLNFRLWDALQNGNPVGVESVATNVAVSDGYFTTQVNGAEEFGSTAFIGEARWLEIGVRCPAGSGSYTTLSPRQALTIVPQAAYAINAWHLDGNSGTNPFNHFIGTTDASPLVFRVNNQQVLRLVYNNSIASPNLVGGYSGNTIPSGVSGATISGGGRSDNINQITANYGTIGGGSGNIITDTHAVIGGGLENTARGHLAAIGGGYQNTAIGWYSTVGGGNNNTAYGDGAVVSGGRENATEAPLATIAGGAENTASAIYATVSGGLENASSGTYAVVSGGYDNLASGHAAAVGGGAYNLAAGRYTFVAGYGAKNSNENHSGVFLFADDHNFSFFSTAANQFRVRSTGGVQFVTGIDGAGNPTAGVQVASGGGSWSSLSDRTLKANFARVDGRAVLAAVSNMPITTWNYTAQDETIRHIGPTAQDFYAAFGVGEDNTHIATIDADGVALAAIQGLNQLVAEKDARISALENRLAALERQGTANASPLATPWPWLTILGCVAILRRKIRFPGQR